MPQLEGLEPTPMGNKHKRYTKVAGEVIFIDESGDPGLTSKSIKSSPFYSIGYVYCQNPSQLQKELGRLLKREHDSKRYPIDLKELKFYLPRTELMSKGYTVEELNKFEGQLPKIRKRP